MSEHFLAQWPQFDRKRFVSAASRNLDALELKERSDQITEAMIQFLPEDYEHAAKILLKSLGTPLLDGLDGSINDEGIAGWAVMPMTHYVGQRGLMHFDLSMELFKEMTKRSSSEFGIRYFLKREPEKTLATLNKWIKDENHHVRRLISEGTRPRLPWGMRLSQFVEDPIPVIEILEQLKDDESEYVRRSVANNLNDIAKDHPEKVSRIAKRWLVDANKERERLIQHACRTLIKNGDKKTLSTFGYKKPKISNACLNVLTPKVELGKNLEFTLSVDSIAKHFQPVIIDYIVHHQKANGTTSPKVFKWRKTELQAKGSLDLFKKHSMKKVTTRVYYPGLHTLEVMINGVSVGKKDFQLVIAQT